MARPGLSRQSALAKTGAGANLCWMEIGPDSRSVVRLTGDAHAFLDSLLTNRISPPIEGGEAIYAGLLTPQGKVVADFYVVPIIDGYLIDAPAARAEAIAQKLRIFRLRRPVTIDLLPDPPDLHFADPRLPRLPARRLGRENLAAEQRIALGLPDLVADASPEEVFALEALFEELRGVDFHKGCFPGQENVSRMKRRATTRKKFCRVQFESAPPAYGAKVRAGEAELGEIRSSVNGRAIALLRLDRACEAMNKGEQLFADEAEIRLDPPDWLIMPQAGVE